MRVYGARLIGKNGAKTCISKKLAQSTIKILLKKSQKLYGSKETKILCMI